MGKKAGFDLKTLLGLLGKEVKDPVVQEHLARAGKVKVTSDHVVAKEADFEFALRLPEGAKKKVLATLFVGDSCDLPKGFERGIARTALLARVPPPARSWVIGKGEVPSDTPGISHETWTVDGLEVTATYRDDKVRRITISLPKDATGGGSLRTSPLHFETKPADAIEDAPLTGMALIVAWAIEKHGLPAKHDNAVGNKLAKREITPRRFLIDACGKAPTTLDVAPKLATFLSTYTDNIHHDAEDGRAKTAAAIKKLLKLKHDDTCSYTDDFLGTFKDVLENPFHVPDSWDAVDRIAPVIDAREADFAKTRFLTSPDVKLYEKAAKARDAVKVTAERKTIPKVTVDDTLAEELVGLIDRSLKDKAVKEVLTRAGLPVGKKIDEQANPAIGVSYMGTNFEIDGKKTLGVDNVIFYAAKQKSYIRGIGGEVEFAGYTGALPNGVRIGMTRDAVFAKLGKPEKEEETYDQWEPNATRRIYASYENGKLVELKFAKPPNW
jgi:hypothetical protein